MNFEGRSGVFLFLPKQYPGTHHVVFSPRNGMLGSVVVSLIVHFAENTGLQCSLVFGGSFVEDGQERARRVVAQDLWESSVRAAINNDTTVQHNQRNGETNHWDMPYVNRNTTHPAVTEWTMLVTSETIE